MSNKVSVIIPTLQKDINVLNMLLEQLDSDDSVSEIILIDNSRKGFESDIKKLRVIIPPLDNNLYVNQSWNLGVKEAKESYFALFNDDLLVCENFCTKVLELIDKEQDFGVLGMSEDSIVNTKITDYPENTDFYIKESPEKRPSFWGAIIFGVKENYVDIPDDIKIWCGDDFIRYSSEKKVYDLENAVVYHLGSLSSNSKVLRPIKHADVFNLARIYPRYKSTKIFKDVSSKYTFSGRLINFLENIFSLKPTYDEKYYILKIMYIRLKIKRKVK